MGGKVAVVDVDPRNSGDVDRTRQMLDGLGVRIFAEVATPGGGVHFYVAGHPELASAHDLNGWPGIDVQSFGSLGVPAGHPTFPKYGGAGYEVISEDLEALADGGDPDGAAAFAGWVAEHPGVSTPRLGRRRPEREASGHATGGVPGRRARRHALRACRDEARFRAQCAALQLCACRRQLHRSAGAGLDEDRAAEVLLAASNHNGLIPRPTASVPYTPPPFKRNPERQRTPSRSARAGAGTRLAPKHLLDDRRWPRA